MEGDSQTSPTTRASESMPDLTTLFLSQLDNYERIRTPKGLWKAWQATQQAEEDSTERIFFNEGKPTWFAYFLAKIAAEHSSHFAGKAEHRRLIARLNDKPIAFRKALAERVAASVSPNARTKTDKIFDKKIKVLQSDNMSQHANKRQRTTDNRHSPGTANPPSSSSTPSIAWAHNPSLDPRHSTLGYRSCFAENEQFLVNASLDAATSLFPWDLSNAIGRDPDPIDENSLVAAISMTFPVVQITGNFACQLALEITDDKVPHFALEWFGVRLETKSGLRYICVTDSSSKILPNPRFTLQGCRRDLISSIFGPEMSKAIMASPLYQDDVKQCRDSTDSISMVISNQAHDRAVVYISLDLWEGTRIRQKLFA